MKQNKFILCLGSNLNAEKNIFEADRRLKEIFMSIKFSSVIQTKAIGEKKLPDYLNQLATSDTDLSENEVKELLKNIEHQLGRSPEDKKNGLIPIDIDLIKWNDEIVKAEDMKRDYVKTLLLELKY